ncbi:MAG: diaminopropionate ammonia-lyase [Elusimicrobia bacterium]|nr:diaminopropionate ammonia-lyase [Elusimicrobiota bacterium]
MPPRTAPKFKADFNRFLDEDVPVPAPPGDALSFHQGLPGYQPTPLYSLPGLAEEFGLGQILLKDESQRFGLKAFKALGASYAIHRWMKANGDPKDVTFCTATDGNHGRAVAWTAKALGRKAVVFVPRNTVPARRKAIEGEGAKVVVVDGTYDETVRRAAAEAAKNGWQVISDTAYPGYMEIPGWIMAGYTTLFAEVDRQLKEQRLPEPDVVFLQAGVGGLACAGVMHYRREGLSRRPGLIVVEPVAADCLRASIATETGEPVKDHGPQDSIMAGLNCGTPSLLSWPLIKAHCQYFLAVDDIFAEEAMRALAAPERGDPKVVSGESGAAGLAGLFALCRKPELEVDREELGLGEASTVLVVSTEGDTDPVNYSRIVGEKE